MADKIEKVCGATIQHGTASNRIYLMKIGGAEPKELVPRLDELARSHGYTKIFAKLPAGAAESFMGAGYIREALVPDFYDGSEDACFLARYFSTERSAAANRDEIESVLELAHQRAGCGLKHTLPAGSAVRICGVKDVDEMAAIYRRVFPSYPFPVHDPNYLLETMRSHVIYFGVETGGILCALASAEMDRESRNAEMTDFATLPGSLGQGLAAILLAAMEPEIVRQNIRTAYTIARAVSPGMNITFARLGYRFGGTLINNTQISGSIESMNVWYRKMPQAPASA